MIYMDLFDGPHSSSGLSWALLGGLEGLTERWALFCCLRFAKLLQNPQISAWIYIPVGISAATTSRSALPVLICNPWTPEVDALQHATHQPMALADHAEIPDGRAACLRPGVLETISGWVHARAGGTEAR